MSKFAENTSVSPEKSRAEIEKILSRYGATGFMYGWQGNAAVLAFVMNQIQVKFTLYMPDKLSKEFTHTPTGRTRAIKQIEEEYLKATRQRWRALALVIKAKLEAVESGITIFEQEFMSHIVLPDGKTVSEFMLPQIERAYKIGKMPNLLPWDKK